MSNEEKEVKPSESKVVKPKKSPKKKVKKVTKSIIKTDVESKTQAEAEIISSVISNESVSKKEVNTEFKAKKGKV